MALLPRYGQPVSRARGPGGNAAHFPGITRTKQGDVAGADLFTGPRLAVDDVLGRDLLPSAVEIFDLDYHRGPRKARASTSSIAARPAWK